MEILQLQYFLESAENENFAKTAEKHFVPTSSVSGSVRRLEKELDCQLFDRGSNRLSLNANGKRLYHALRIAFDEVSQAIEDLRSADVDNREIQLLVRTMRGNVTDYIIEHNRLKPHVGFRINFDMAERDFEKYDIIIDEKTDRYPTYEALELCRMELRLTTSRGSPLCRRKLTMKQLANQPFISLGENSNIHKVLLDACRRAGFTPNIAILSNDMKYYEKLVESGIGIGIERNTPQNLLRRNIAYLDVTDFEEEAVVYAYFKKHSAYGNVGQFLQFLKTKDFI